ncbi:MAG: hypothetical protein LBP20_08945 [Treponema sp.]|jgi:hypothetical protein|nr:hypothetical protein [Treponema sp.]
MNNMIARFKSPPKEYSPLAFWFWNGTLKTGELVRQIDEMSSKGVHGAFMHPRAYLKTPYLEQEWWDAVGACVERSREIGFSPWIYDEYAWPSGTAGSTFEHSYQKPSRVLARGEQNMAKGLRVNRYEVFGTAALSDLICGEAGTFVAAFSLSGKNEPVPPEGTASDGGVMVFFREVYPGAVDYLNKNTIRYFIELTHEEYRKRWGSCFGSLIPGVFFDEIYMASRTLPWTDALPEEFEKRCGYSLLPHLPALVTEGEEDSKRIRGDYFRVIAELYEEAFFIQISQWCQNNNLMLTGHTEERLAGHPGRQGNYFNTIRHLQIPGADNHDYRYRFPRKITCVEPKYSVSVARAYNRKRAMSEAMGGAGWGCSLQQFKRGVNTMAAMGISMFILHGFHYECEHQGSQADWPTSFFYQNPYWKYFNYFAVYMNRVCCMNALGTGVVEMGLFYPIYDMQINTVNGRPNEDALNMERAFHDMLNTLLERQIDTDIIDGESLLRAEVSGDAMQAGQQRFRVLLFPCGVTLGDALRAKLMEFRASGGHVVFYHGEGQPAVVPAEFSGNDTGSIPAIPRLLDGLFMPDILVLEGSRSNLYACHRRINGLDIYYVSNSSNRGRELTLQLREAGSVQKMDIETGEVYPIPSAIAVNGATVLHLRLGEDEACYLLIARDGKPAEPVGEPEEREEIALSSLWTFLPQDKSFDGRYCIDGESTELQIPLATFADDLHGGNEPIRICNIDGEKGFCGRHLSLWQARWIARRPSWNCGADTDLYFRKTFDLEAEPEWARVCFAALTDCTLYINGKEVFRGASGGRPVSADIVASLRKGRNCIAAYVHHDNPINSFTALHELPANRIIAFLLQGEVVSERQKTPPEKVRAGVITSDESWIVTNRFHEGWQSPDSDFEACFADVTQAQSFGQGVPDGQWIYAWERGRPPLHPWGDLPLFDQELTFPRKLTYGISIPAGTGSIKKPEVCGDFSGLLDGVPITWDCEWIKIKNDGRSHYLTLEVTAAGREDGLQYPVTVSVSPFRVPLADWRLYGYPWFSGRMRYQNTVRINKKKGHYVIDLGQVNFSAEVWVNGRLAGVRVWNPYRVDITDLLTEGENSITVVAANSAAVERRRMLVDEGMALGWNRYWNEDNIDREGENLVSGLLGPVRIFRYEHTGGGA